MTKNIDKQKCFPLSLNEKPIQRGELPKKGGLGQFADLRGVWQERGGWGF